jgi:predicted nucleotidyltransferase
VVGPLALHRDAVYAACDRYRVNRLAVFGSAVTDRFVESSSDVDFLVDFRDDLGAGSMRTSGSRRQLEALLDRSVVDLPGHASRRYARTWFGQSVPSLLMEEAARHRERADPDGVAGHRRGRFCWARCGVS